MNKAFQFRKELPATMKNHPEVFKIWKAHFQYEKSGAQASLDKKIGSVRSQKGLTRN